MWVLMNTQVRKAKLTWHDVEKHAPLLFDVWVGQPELWWAESAWKGLETHGLTSYADEVEHQAVLVRLLALATMYQEFCYMAWDMGLIDYDGIPDRAREIGISPFRVGQLVGPQFEAGESDGDSLFYSALVRLTNKVRPAIYQALLEAFGGDAMLFVALWNSRKRERTSEDEVENEDGYEEDADAILNDDLTGSKMRAWCWLAEGMPFAG